MFHEVNFFHLVLLTSVERGFCFESLLQQKGALSIRMYNNILFGGELLVPRCLFPVRLF